MDIPETNLFIFLTFMLILLNAFFILTEATITASHKNQLEKLIDEDVSLKERALKAIKIIDEPNIYLTSVQIGTVSCNILIGLFTGIAIAPFLAMQIKSILSSTSATFLNSIDYIEILSLIFSAFLVILLCLILSTTLPRKIALNNPEILLLKTLVPLNIWQKILSPFIKVFMAVADTILLVFGINPKHDDSVTEDEVKDLIERGREEGTFEKAEQDLVDRIFHMSDQTAYSLMTPRTQMLWLDLEDSLEANLKLIKENNTNVFLICKENLDDFVGIIYAKDILNTLLNKQELNLEKLIKKPMFVPRAMESFRLLEKFRQTEINEAVVLDEYGGVVGFITIFDIINEVLGDITGEKEKDAPQLIQHDENSWYLDGLYEIDDFKEKFDIEELPREDSGHFKTMGGFITSYFGYIPKVSEVRIWDRFRFEIISMDKARVDKILVTVLNK